MNKTFPLVLALPLLLAACGGGSSTPASGPVPGADVTVQLYKTLNTGWALGAGDVALRAFTLDKSVGTVVASGSVDALGRGTLTLPGETGGILAKATLPARIVSKVLSSVCTDTFTETDPTARAVMLTTGDFSTSQGGTALYLLPSLSETGLHFDVPLFVTRDNTLTGNLLCGEVSAPITLSLKRGWNLVRYGSVDDKLSLSVVPFGGLLSFGTKSAF